MTSEWKLTVEKDAGSPARFFLHTGLSGVGAETLSDLVRVIDTLLAAFTPSGYPRKAMFPEPIETLEPEPEPAQQPEPAPTSEQKNGGGPMLGAEPAAVTLPTTEPEQMPVIERSSHDVATEKSRVERSRLVTLRSREDGLFLNLDGSGTTDDVRYAYRGNENQAKRMRAASPIAKDMNIYTYRPTMK